ncbi:MAG: CCA tRNA nucleotidyltransferase [Candidatus Magasanikbacteria bacterium]
MNKKELFNKIYQVSEELETPVYVVGGYIRDELMEQEHPGYKESLVVEERNPIKPVLEQDVTDEETAEPEIIKPKSKEDIDFTLEGSGVEFAQEFDEKVDIGSLVLFEDFDTARYVIEDDHGGFELEFAGTRKESYQENSRKPDVESATLEEDLHRRDFTVNAMAKEIQENSLGELIDPFGGKEDLEEKKLATPHDPDNTFQEDPLRMLRGARFAAKLDFDLEDRVKNAIKDNSDRLSIISSERIRDEFLKLLSTPKPSIGLWILYNTDLFDEFLPEIKDFSREEERQGISHKDNLAHTFEVVDNIAKRTNNELLVFAALLHDIGKPETKEFDPDRGWTFDMHEHVGRRIVFEIGDRLNMSKNDTEYVADLVRWHQQPVQLIMDSDNITDSAVRKLVVELEEQLDDLLKLGRSDITTGSPEREQRYLENYDKLEEKIIEVIHRDKLRKFQSPVDGDEIMEVCGLKPGPTVGKIKEDIENAILNGEIVNEYEPAKEYLQNIKSKYLDQAEDWELRN